MKAPLIVNARSATVLQTLATLVVIMMFLIPTVPLIPFIYLLIVIWVRNRVQVISHNINNVALGTVSNLTTIPAPPKACKSRVIATHIEIQRVSGVNARTIHWFRPDN